MLNIKNREELLTHIEKDSDVEYLFFWGHQKPKNGVSKSCFSQWYESPFSDDGVQYKTAEHYMMAEKAKLFNDEQILSKILNANKPIEVKKLGRKIQNFKEDTWLKHRFDIVRKANLLKFDQNSKFKDFLLNTNNKVLVEASPVDNVWGIGMASDNPLVQDPQNWKGLNLLGFALMVVREELR